MLFENKILQELSIVTQNIWGFPNILKASKNIQELLKKILEFDPDVILLQEVFREEWLTANSQYLKDYQIFYCKKRFLIQGGLVILIKEDTVKKINKKGYEINCHFLEFKRQGILVTEQIFSHISKKGILQVEFSYANQIKANIINIHTTSAFNNNQAIINKKLIVLLSQIKEIFDKLKNTQKQELIAGGDFNYDIGKYLFDQNISDYEYNHYPNHNITTLPKENSRIDFILTNSIHPYKINIIKPSMDDNKKPYSDHQGVMIRTN